MVNSYCVEKKFNLSIYASGYIFSFILHSKTEIPILSLAIFNSVFRTKYSPNDIKETRL